MGTTKRGKLPTGVRIRTHSSGKETLYIHFTYKGVKCPEPLSNRKVDASNIKYAERLRGEILNKIDNDTFVYADYFPNSTKLKLFGKARSNEPLEFYAEQAYDNACKRGLKSVTLLNYRGKYNLLIEKLGKINPEEIDIKFVKNFYIQLYDDGMGVKALKLLRVALNATLDEVLYEGRIAINPASQVSLAKILPAASSWVSNKRLNPFSLTEINHLWETNKYSHHLNIFKIWWLIGVRTGELCALTWKDLNLEYGVLKIRRNYVSTVGVTNTPKTKAGVRDISLSDEAIQAFKEHYEREKLFDPEFVKPDSLIFKKLQPYGSQYSTTFLNVTFKEFCFLAGVTPRSSYQLRHTHATMRISRGENLWAIAKDLGHASPNLLFSNYGDYISDYEHSKK
ncbi:Arm DNA-binding domain-containing protein [Pseudoalteromonas sp.]|uniref:Arm DNA-binding domain-containing protein n=1 Tax=Pseudoalteromonas sp. TaxID=53249 RepID=UPI00272C4AD9|nr:DUF3596 domain-containing protein [Pseudoalteromonas sp.]